MAGWNPAFAALHLGFAQLQSVRCWENSSTWVDCATLTQQLPQGLRSVSGLPLRFVPQDHTLPFPELYYEERIFQHGMIATRANWHDFFNALMWALYPQTKVQINALHAADLQHYGKVRTAQRDALTLLDESGVVIAASRRELLELVQGFAWEQLFGQEREAWGRSIGCFLLGHATLEKLLTPYIGLTAQALLLEVTPAFFHWQLAEQQAYVDALLARLLSQGQVQQPANLNPFPLLGIPDWWAEQTPAFYQNTAYFRPRTRQRAVNIVSLTV